MDVTLLTRPACLPTRAAAAPVPPIRTLRIRLNPSCLSRPDAAAAAAAKKPTRPGQSHDEEPPPPAKRRRIVAAADEKVVEENASAPAKIGNLLLRRPCSRGDEAPRSPAKRKAGTPNSSGQANRRGSSPQSRVLIATTKKKQQQVGDGGAASSSASPSPRSSDSEGTVRVLLAKARPASDAIRRRDMERLRAQARWEMEQVVQTVEFNDPFLSPQDV